MKPEREIRKHLADLRANLTLPCQCEGLDRLLCMANMEQLKVFAGALAWVLGEHPNYDAEAERMAKKIAEARAAGAVR